MLNQYTFWKNGLSLLTSAALAMSLCAVPVSAVDTGKAPVFATDLSGTEVVSLSAPDSLKVHIPVKLSEAEAKKLAKTVKLSLTPDKSKPAYVDPKLYPFTTKGGPLEDWTCKDGETPFFTNVETTAETVDGQVCLTVTFDSQCYFLDDLSVPHINGGYYLDVCGDFQLSAKDGGKVLGSAPLKILPYDSFLTMDQIYQELNTFEKFAAENTSLYVEQFSMGKSQGDNGMEALDMPYLIIAKDKAAVEKWKSIKALAESDPTALLQKIEDGSLGDYQVPVMYSNVHSNEVTAIDGMLEYIRMLLTAASQDGKLDYKTLTGFTEAGKQELAVQMGPKGKEGSKAIPDLVADKASYLGSLLGKKEDGSYSKTSIAVDMEKYYNIETKTADVHDILDDIFYIFVPEENVEGRTYITRTSSGGFDLNRDNSFQTQNETQNMGHLIAQWNPVSFVEFHGRVRSFQCEPCDPPHEPNFEYDLLSEHLMGGGEAMGITAVANNTAHNSFVIPQRDYLTYTGKTAADGKPQTIWADPWDDMSTSYTPQYAMLHGTVSYTVEVPAYDQHMVTAQAYGQLGQSVYIADNKESYLVNQATNFQRGVSNANSDGFDQVGQWFADQYDVEGAEAKLFRPEYDGQGQNGNFYPECYIIPMDSVNQGSLQAAADMMLYLTRNGVKVQLAEKPFTYGGVTYPAGTMVVPMYQAKRSVANGVLNVGTVITSWTVLYSEGITAFDKTRGFDMAVCAEPAAYKTISAACGEQMDYPAAQTFLSAFGSQFTGVKNAQVILVNASEDSTAAVNALLKSGKAVSVISEGQYKGSFLCSYADYLTVADDFLLTGVGVSSAPAAMPMAKAPVVYISGKPGPAASGFIKSKLTSGAYTYNYDRQAMESLGFTVTENAAEADLIIGASALDDAALAAVKSGTAYIGYGAKAIPSAQSLFPEGALVRETAGEEAMDALAYVTYPSESPVTASYVAEGDNILYGYGAGYFAAVPQGSKVLVKLDGSKPLMEGFLPATGEHYQDFLNSSVQAISYEGKGADNADLNVVLFANTLTNKTHQRDEYNFISNTAFAQVAQNTAPATRSSLVSQLYQLSGSPAVSAKAPFADADSAAVAWAYANGIAKGKADGTFAPNQALTVEQAAAMLYRYAKVKGQDVTAAGSLASLSSSPADYAKTPMAWALAKGLVAEKNPKAILSADGLTAMLKAVQ